MLLCISIELHNIKVKDSTQTQCYTAHCAYAKPGQAHDEIHVSGGASPARPARQRRHRYGTTHPSPCRMARARSSFFQPGCLPRSAEVYRTIATPEGWKTWAVLRRLRRSPHWRHHGNQLRPGSQSPATQAISSSSSSP